ncbi:MAG: NADH-quinone oxidoreductase subunit J [Chloroflexota bacterium]
MGLALTFWIMAVVTVAAALGVVFIRNVFRAALTLILCFIAVAGLYITLSADFLAAVQILVYVGAISVLIILAVMMTREVQRGSPVNKMEIPAAVVATVLLGILVYTVTNTPWKIAAESPLTPTTVPPGHPAFQRERLYPAGGNRGGAVISCNYRRYRHHEGEVIK